MPQPNIEVDKREKNHMTINRINVSRRVMKSLIILVLFQLQEISTIRVCSFRSLEFPPNECPFYIKDYNKYERVESILVCSSFNTKLESDCIIMDY